MAFAQLAAITVVEAGKMRATEQFAEATRATEFKEVVPELHSTEHSVGSFPSFGAAACFQRPQSL